MDIPVYVINLTRSVLRKKHITGQLKNADVPFKIIDAVDGAELSDQEIRNNPDFGLWKNGSRTRYLFKGEIGCVSSHFKIYQKMIKENIDMVCILEDDIEVNSEFKYFLNYENLKAVDWDLFYLGHHSQYSKKAAWSKNKKELKFPNYSVGEPIELPGGSYGYIIRKEAAMKILKHGYPIRKSLDHYIGNAPALGIRTLLLLPPCVTHNYMFGTTMPQNSDIDYNKSLIEFFRKQFRKTYKWFPFLQVMRIWLNVNLNLSVRFLRKIGFLKGSYAKCD